MADAITLLKSPQEAMKAFNQRLLASCQEVAVTSVQMSVVSGQPVVTLFSEIVEADQEDVDKSNGEIKLEELIPSDDPIYVQVCELKAGTTEEVTKSQNKMNILYGRADGGVTSVQHAVGNVFGFIENPKKEIVFCQQEAHFALVAYNSSDEVEEDGEEDAPGDPVSP